MTGRGHTLLLLDQVEPFVAPLRLCRPLLSSPFTRGLASGPTHCRAHARQVPCAAPTLPFAQGVIPVLTALCTSPSPLAHPSTLQLPVQHELSSLHDFHRPFCVQGVLPAVTGDQLPRLLACAAPFETAFRTHCLGRMSEAVAPAFPGGQRSLPSPADVQKCIG